MNFKTSILLLGAAMAVTGAAQAAADVAPSTTPMGITFQPLGSPQGYGPQRVNPSPRPYVEVV